MTNRSTIKIQEIQKLFIFCCYISQFLSYKKCNKMIKIDQLKKLLTLLKTIQDDQNILLWAKTKVNF